MKKIPMLFERILENGNVAGITDQVIPGMEWVLRGEGTATIKWDGSCCAIIDGKLYRRFDAKEGRRIPEGAIPCQLEPDGITGHWPHWVKCRKNNPNDKWYLEAFENAKETSDYLLSKAHVDGRDVDTFEAIGLHFNGNPYRMETDILVSHGMEAVKCERSFEGIREFIVNHNVEGLVFWKDGEPKCKIRYHDFFPEK